MDLVQPRIDPDVPNWHASELPRAWPDRDRYTSFLGSLLLMVYAIVSTFGRRREVRVAAGLPGAAQLPGYLLQEFHGMPNGYYSQRLANDYPRGFELAMLGQMRHARRRIAQRLAGRGSVLEVGAGAGLLLRELEHNDVEQIWGLDASAYNLKTASGIATRARLVQGLAEALPFPDARFDAVCACFLFHELPSEVAGRAIAELARVLKPGGLLLITEPSPAHLRTPIWRLLLTLNFRALYYRSLAAAVYEPYIDEWLDRDLSASFAANGCELVEERTGVPFHELTAQRLPS